MTYPRNARPGKANSVGADVEKAAFLRDMRALRDQAGLGSRDLAARAHFPEDTLITAEAGPALPSLPVLQAYVRGCGAGEAEWEDRWRHLNQEDANGSSALPTRAPSANRPPARIMPFPETGPADPDAIGFGLARVARSLAPFSSDPPPAPPETSTYTPFGGDGGGMAGNGGTDRSAQYSGPEDGPAGASGWFEPTARSAPPAPPSPPPSLPPVSPGEPTLQYPAAPEYTPSNQLPEEFRTAAPEPPAEPEASRVPADLGTPVAAAPATPRPHAAPAPSRRRTSAWIATAVILVLIIAALLWLLLGH